MNKLISFFLWPAYWFGFPLRLRASLLVLVEDEVLVVKNRWYYGSWNLPGGGVKLREDPAVSAAREAREELGIDVDSSGLARLHDGFVVVREFGLLSRHVFYVYRPDKKPDIAPNKEIIAYSWQETTSAQLGKDVLTALSKV